MIGGATARPPQRNGAALGMRADALAILLLCTLPFIYFWRVTLGWGVWFTRDLSRVYYPFAALLARDLRAGRFPLWVDELQNGFPLVAEGQSAALYPPQLFLLAVLSPESAISVAMLLHLAWAAIGMYLAVRGAGLPRASALLAGVTFGWTGFLIQKLYHTPILLTAAWLPWLIFLLEGFQRARAERQPRAGGWLIALTLALGVQWFAGSAQFALFNSLVYAGCGFFSGMFWQSRGEPWRARWRTIPRVIFWTALPLVLSGGIAAIQLAPSYELFGFSARVQGASDKYLNEFALTPETLWQFVAPFTLGEPSDDNVEQWCYVGVTALVWALGAILVRRDARTWFYFIFALVAFSLMLGAVNPLFQALMALPLFNAFRIPPRFALYAAFGVAWLNALLLDALARRASPAASRWTWVIAGGTLAAVLGVIGLAETQPLDFWFAAWRILAGALGCAALATLALAWRRALPRGVVAAGMIGLVALDLAAYAAPFLSTTVARLTPPAYVTQVPRSVPALDAQRLSGRVLTDERIWPSVPALRSSLYPNFGALYGYEMAHIYSPLRFDRLENYVNNLSPAMLNVMHVRYFAMPLEPRFDDRLLTPDVIFALDILENPVTFAPTPAVALQIESFTEGTAKLADGTPVAQLRVRFADGAMQTFALRLGIETADWDDAIRHPAVSVPRGARVARAVPGFLRAAGTNFEGKVYQARFEFAPGSQVVEVMVQPLIARGKFALEKISLLDAQGRAHSVAALSGKNDFALRYMSDTTAIWENLAVLPRAFLAHRAEILAPGEIFPRMQRLDFRPAETVLLTEGQPLEPARATAPRDHIEIVRHQPGNIALTVATDAPGYLVLADSWYPDWRATVDGNPVAILRADYLFRAVFISPGEHQVAFEYIPVSFIVGGVISVTTLLVTLGIALFLRRSFGSAKL